MKIRAILLAMTAVSGCAQKMPEYDAGPVISQFTAAFKQNSGANTLRSFPVQASNLKTPCNLTLMSAQAPVFDELNWYGDCLNGEASGLGLVVVTAAGKKSVSVENLTPGGANDKVYYQHHFAQDIYNIGVGDTAGFSGKTLTLYREGGYLSPVEGYFRIDLKERIHYSLLQNDLTGVTSWMKMNSTGTGLVLSVSNDYTNNIAQNFRLGQQGTILLDAVKLQNGSVVTLQNGQYVNAQSVVPFVTSQLSDVDPKLVSAPAAYAEGTRKIAELKYRLCPGKDNEEVTAFCDDQPFSVYQSDFARAAQEFKSAQQQRLANIESQRVEAMRQQQIQQQNYQALNASLAQLNQTSQQLQRNLMQNMQTYTPPTVINPSINQTSIYTCQDVSNWTYCRQQR